MQSFKQRSYRLTQPSKKSLSVTANAQFIEEPLSELTRMLYQDKSGWAFGLGLVKPYKRYSMYAGIEWLSSAPLFGAGVRYSF